MTHDANLYEQTLRVDENRAGHPRNCSVQRLPRVRRLVRPARARCLDCQKRTIRSADLQMPQVHQASISHDRQLTSSVVVQTSHQMLRGRRTMRSRTSTRP